MLIRSEGIVLHQVKYGDHSAIVKVYTRHCGMMSFIVNGMGRKRQNGKGALLQPLSLIELVIRQKETRSLQRMRELHPVHPYESIPFFSGKTAQALFIAEVLLRTIKEEERNDTLFEFLRQSILLLDHTPGELPDFHLKFLLDLSRFLGFYPVDNYSPETPFFQFTDGVFLGQQGKTCFDRDVSRAIALLLRNNFDRLHTLSFNHVQRRILVRTLLDYFRWHLPGISGLKTPAVLEEVFA